MTATKRKAKPKPKPKPKPRRTVGERLRKIGACEEACNWADQYTSAQKAWDACDNPSFMRWALDSVLDLLSQRYYHTGRAECDDIRKHFPKPPRVSK